MRAIDQTHFLPFPIDMVWDALTDAEQLGAWLMPNDFRPEVGHRFTFRTDPAPEFDGIVNSEVLAMDPPHRLALAWRGGPLDTTVSFALESVSGGTRVRLRHEGFAGLSNLMSRIVLGIGWRKLVRSKLSDHLQGRGTPDGAGDAV